MNNKKFKKPIFKKVKYTIKNSKFDSSLTVYCFDAGDNSIIRVIRIQKKWLTKYLFSDLVEKISNQYKDNVIE